MSNQKTEILIFRQSVVLDGFFNESNNPWLQGIFWPLPGSPATETWRIDIGSATHIGPGQGSMQQNGVLRVGENYKVKIKVSNMTPGDVLRVRMSATLIPGPSFVPIFADGDYEFDMTADIEDFILECSGTFLGTVSNISVVPVPYNYYLDLNDNVLVALTFQAQDLSNIENRKSTRSLTITLPGTKTNNQIFGEIFEISGSSDYNVNKKADVVILSDGIEQFKGTLQIKDISISNYEDISYNVVVIGTLANISSDWGDKTLQDLSFKEYTHTYNMTEVMNSWVGPIKKNGAPYNNFSVTGTIAITTMTIDGIGSQARVKLTFGSAHGFTVDDDIFIDTNNNLLSGDHTIYSVPSSTTIVLNFAWSMLTDVSTPTGTVSIRTYNGDGYYYGMVDRTGKDGNTSKRWYVNEFLPQLHVKEIIDKAFALEGYTYDAPFFNSAFFKRLVINLNSDNFKLTPDQMSSNLFRAAQTTSINTSYNLYPLPSGPYGKTVDFVSTPPMSGTLSITHHKVNQTTGIPIASLTGTVPCNDVSTNPNFDNTTAYNTVLYKWVTPAIVTTGPLDYTFFFSGKVTNAVIDNYAYNGVSGDMPSDLGAAGGIYASYNGALYGPSDDNGIPLDSGAPLTNNTLAGGYYSGMYDQEIVLMKQTATFPFLTRVASFGSGGTQPWMNKIVQGSATVSLMPGDIVYCVYYGNNKAIALRADGKPAVGTSSGGANGAVKVTFKLANSIFYNQVAPVANMENIIYDPTTLLPNIKIKDFFKSIVNMFNLLITEDKVDSKKLIIRPYPQFYNTNTPIDWTEKLNIDKDITLTPMSELNAKKYIFKYKNDNDFYNKDYVADWGAINNRNYGDYFINIDNDFVTGANTTELLFSPSPLVGRPYAYASCDRTISTIFSSDGIQISPLSTQRIFIRSLRGTDTLLQIASGTQTNPNPLVAAVTPEYPTTLWKYFPYVGHLDNTYGPKYDINFSYPLALYYNNDSYTDNNLYNEYYKQFIEEITDRDSKLLSGEFRLNAYDINTLDFRNIFLVDGHLLRLMKINNYDLNGDGLTQCEFLKIKNGIKFVPRRHIGIHSTAGIGLLGNPPMETNRVIGNNPHINFGSGNTVGATAENIIISGDNNAVYDNAKNVVIQNGSRNIVPSGVTNVTIINSNDVVATKSGEVWINNVEVSNANLHGEMLTYDATPVSIVSWTPGAKAVITVEAFVSGSDSGFSAVCGGRLMATFYYDDAIPSITQLGTTDASVNSLTGAETCLLMTDGVNIISVVVRGIAGVTMEWSTNVLVTVKYL